MYDILSAKRYKSVVRASHLMIYTNSQVVYYSTIDGRRIQNVLSEE